MATIAMIAFNPLHPYQQRINAFLAEILPKTDNLLHQAMRYSVLGSGKRLRPSFVYAVGEIANAPEEKLNYAAAAVELIHNYSLIHDDLPAMDNAALRHGKPSCHQAFDEATAILAGDALQSLAFGILAKNNNCQQITLLAQAIGAQGMALGQAFDLAAEKNKPDLSILKTIHYYKTGALITASVQLGLLCGEVDATIFDTLTAFATCIGIAFQIQDDILDIESPTDKLGKLQGTDVANHKITYPSLLGMAKAKQQRNEMYQQALHLLSTISGSLPLKKIAEFIVQRDY